MRDITNGFDDGFTGYVFFTPTIVATVLLLIRNYITAIIGATIYTLSFLLSIFMNYSLGSMYRDDQNYFGFGPLAILIVLFTAAVISIVHSVKLTKNRKQKRKETVDLLDDTL